jgi:hypothetical protein
MGEKMREPGAACHARCRMPNSSCRRTLLNFKEETGVEKPDDVPKNDRKMDWFKFLIKLKGKEVKGKSSFKNRLLPRGRAEEFKFA